MPHYSEPTLWERVKGYAFHLFPHHWLSRAIYYLTRLETPLKNPFVRAYIRFFKVEMDEAEASYAEDYRSFNHFFTRSLKPGSRPIHEDPRTLVYPCEGAVAQMGNVEEGELFQAKNQRYRLDALLGNSSFETQKDARAFTEGRFITIYLSPANYHRIHAPCDIKLKAMTHIPGRLFSAAEYSWKVIPRLYARNERVICIFDSDFGDIAIVMVGALNVGSIETVWSGPVTPKNLAASHWRYTDEVAKEISFARGEEIGRFNMGSTVIMLVSNPKLKWNPLCVPGKKVRMGEESGWVDKGENDKGNGVETSSEDT